LDGGGDGRGAGGDVGAGVRVEGLQLAGAALQPEEDDRPGRGARFDVGGAGEQLADRGEPGGAGQAGAGEEGAAGPGGYAQWLHANLVELMSAQYRSSSFWPRVDPGSARKRSKCSASSSVGRRVKTAR